MKPISEQEVYDAIPRDGIDIKDLADKLGVLRIQILSHAKKLSEKIEMHGNRIIRNDHIAEMLEEYRRESEQRLPPPPYEDPELYPEIMNCIQDENKAKELISIFLKYYPGQPWA